MNCSGRGGDKQPDHTYADTVSEQPHQPMVGHYLANHKVISDDWKANYCLFFMTKVMMRFEEIFYSYQTPSSVRHQK